MITFKEEVKDAPDPTLKGAEYIHSSAAARADGTEVNFSPAALIAENVYSKESNDEFTHKVYGNLPSVMHTRKCLRIS